MEEKEIYELIFKIIPDVFNEYVKEKAENDSKITPDIALKNYVKKVIVKGLRQNNNDAVKQFFDGVEELLKFNDDNLYLKLDLWVFDQIYSKNNLGKKAKKYYGQETLKYCDLLYNDDVKMRLTEKTHYLGGNGKTKDIFAAWLTNKSYYEGYYDFPFVAGRFDGDIDYITLYSETGKYQKTFKTMVVFCIDDYKFDDWDKLFYAIIYQKNSVLERFKRRFKNVYCMAAPDYSTYSNMPLYWQIFNIAKARIVLLWLTLECGIKCIPTAAWGNEKTYDWCFDGIEKDSTVFLSIKGACRESKVPDYFTNGLKALLEKVNPKHIIVYTDSAAEKTKEMLKPAIEAGVEIVIPNNTLLERNMILKDQRQHKKKHRQLNA